MKKIMLSVAVFFTIGISATFAGNDLIKNPKAQEVFKKEFAGAEQVKWDQEAQYTKASFVLGGNSAIALFNQDGELLGSMRNLFYNQLPLAVITSFEKRFSTATIIDITEMINADGTRYKFTLENKGKKYRVSVYADGAMENVEKKRK